VDHLAFLEVVLFLVEVLLVFLEPCSDFFYFPLLHF
jgi:hypothetical protein